MHNTINTDGLNKLLSAIKMDYEICLRESEQKLFESKKRQEFDNLFSILSKSANMIGRLVCVYFDCADLMQGKITDCNFMLTGCAAGCNLALYSNNAKYGKEIEITSIGGEFYRIVSFATDSFDCEEEALCEEHDLICAISFYIQTRGQLTGSLNWVKNENQISEG